MHIAPLITIIFITGILCQEKYPSKYDNIDLESILKNERLLKNYVDCLVDKGKCSKEGEELKKRIPEGLETECEKCSEKHRNGIRRVIKHLVENNKELWNDLVLKYDSEGVYRKKYEALSKKEGIQV